ncbi:hypothetical protein LI073_11460 [bacterium 210917-SL.2.15]|nr:hypothetical protein [bacterium 210917-SL.2.15]
MQLYMTATPEQYRLLSGLSFRLSHLAYQIGTDGHLHRATVSRQMQSGLLALNDATPPAISDPTALSREILRECMSRGYEGVAADFGSSTTPDRMVFLEEAAKLLHRNSKKLFLSAAYGRRIPTAYVLVNTAISGGTLRTMLVDACNAFGRGRVALDIERLRMDFPLPSPTGEGTPLTKESFDTLYQDLSPSVFFSHELCAKYFTYQRDGRAHFVLFDDADTIRFKLKLAQSLDLRWAFLLCSEVEDILPQLHQ